MAFAQDYGPLMIDLQGLELEGEERELLLHPLVGGVLLFARNYDNPEQLSALVGTIRRQREPLLLGVDYEGGRVQRFRQGVTRLPSPRRIGDIYDDDPDRALELARQAGWLAGSELRCLTIDLPLAPVLDLDAGLAEVIGDRAWHRRPEAVAALAKAHCTGLAQAGVASTGKHFPGHGRVVVDSHRDLPVDERNLDEVRATDLMPFAELIRSGSLDSIMVAHIRYPQVDELPASLSRAWIEQELRGRLGFTGAVFCDDLSMGGAAAIGDHLSRARLALEAGCDMLPVCNDRGAVVELLDRLRWAPTGEQKARLAALRTGPGDSLAALQETSQWSAAATAIQSIS